MKQQNIKFLLALLITMLGVYASAHDIEVANADGKTIYYNFIIKSNTELEVSYRGSKYDSYSNEYSGNVVIPEFVTYDGKTYSVTNIGYQAFYRCSDLTSVNIPNSVTSIEGSAFFGCRGLTSVNIPNSVTHIGISAFSGTAWYDNQPNGLVYAGKVVYGYKGTMPSNIVIKEGTLGIAESAFDYDSNLTSVTIPSSVTCIGEYAFYCCSGLTRVNIPNSVTSIGRYAFDGTAWYNNQPDGLMYAGKVAYKYKGTMPSNTSIVIEEGTLGIAGNAFFGCSGLTSVTIPNSVTSIGHSAFEGCWGLTSVYISDLAAWCTISFSYGSSNPLYNAHHLFLNGQEIKDLVIPNSVASIKNYTFYYLSGLTSVTIPNSVTSIGLDAFAFSGLTSVTIPSSVTSIGVDAFAFCYGLTSVNIPNSVTSIGGYAFSNCYGLTSVNIPNSVTNIGDYVFCKCSSLRSITIPNSVTSIGDYAFDGCSGLTSITIPNSVASIGDYAFSGCSSLTSIIIPNSVTSIGDYAFSNDPQLTDFYCYTKRIPYTVSTAFDGSHVNYATLHVPESAIETYKAMAPWNGFQKIVSIEGGDQLLETVKVEVGSQGVVTFSPVSDVDFTSVSGVKAYIGSGFNRKTGVLTMTRVYDVPAGEGLLLKGASGTYQIPYKQSYSIYSNLLNGVSSETNLSATTGDYVNYVLGSGSSGTGFYRVPVAGTTLSAGHAYLQIPAETAAGSRALTISFNDENEATAISDVERQDCESAVYDLQGRRVEQPRSGLYIRNGKKVIIK